MYMYITNVKHACTCQYLRMGGISVFSKNPVFIPIPQYDITKICTQK